MARYCIVYDERACGSNLMPRGIPRQFGMLYFEIKPDPFDRTEIISEHKVVRCAEAVWADFAFTAVKANSYPYPYGHRTVQFVSLDGTAKIDWEPSLRTYQTNMFTREGWDIPKYEVARHALQLR